MNIKTTIGLIILIFLVLGGGLSFALTRSNTSCSSTALGVTHTVTIKDGKPSNGDIQAKLCDRLTITNQDDVIRHIAFGVHEKHVAYDGVSEKFLTTGQSLSVVLDKVGTFHWHDHDHDEVEGYFTTTR